MALMALALRSERIAPRRAHLVLALGLFGAALFYGDGVITPAISVLSAVEGLEVATPALEALRRAADPRRPDRLFRHPATRHGQGRHSCSAR